MTRRTTTRRAVATLALALAGILVASSAPTDAATAPWWWWFTTTSSAPTTTAAPTTTLPPAGPDNPCGGDLPKADGGVWECTWYDEFDGTTLDTTRWAPVETAKGGFKSGDACFMNTPENVSVADGSLHLTARKEERSFLCQKKGAPFYTKYTSGSVNTAGLFSQAYGRFEIRAKFPPAKVKGLQSALWLWPDDPLKYGAWPKSGEIDIAEFYSLYHDRAIPYIHYNPATWDQAHTNNYCMVDQADQFHTYVAEWTETAITILFDGEVCVHNEWVPAAPLVKPQPFDHPFMVVLTQALGVTENAFSATKTPLPATTSVDYVRVWE